MVYFLFHLGVGFRNLKGNGMSSSSLLSPVAELIETREETVSRGLVARINSLEISTDFHDENASWTGFLRSEMLAERFDFKEVVLASAILDGKEYLLNGLHCTRAWAQGQTVEDTGITNTVQYIRYKIRTMEKAEYLRYDLIHGCGPHFLSLIKQQTEWKGVSQKAGQLILNGFRFWKWPEKNISPAKKQVNAVRSLLTTDVKIGTTVGKFLTDCALARSLWHRRGIIAAMLESFSIDPSSAELFWSGVVTGVGMLDRNDPRLILRDHLGDMQLRRLTQRSGSAEFMQVCLKAYDKFRS